MDQQQTKPDEQVKDFLEYHYGQDNVEINNFFKYIYKLYADDQLPFSRRVYSDTKFSQGEHVKYKAGGNDSVPGYASAQPQAMIRAIPIITILAKAKVAQMLANPPVPVIAEKMDQDPDKARAIALATQKKLEAVMKQSWAELVEHKWLWDTELNHVGWTRLFNDQDGVHWKNADFDNVLIYPRIEDSEESPVIGLRFTGIIGEYKKDPNYDMTGIVPKMNDDKPGARKPSNGLMKPKSIGRLPADDLNTFEAVEWKMKIRLTEKNIPQLAKRKCTGDKTCDWILKKNPGQQIILVVTTSQNHVIRYTFFDSDSYHVYPLTFESGQLYGTSEFHMGISMNKSIDNIITQIEWYAATALKYRIIAQKDSNIGEITNVNGEIIEYEGEVPPSSLSYQDIPQGLFMYLNQLVNLCHFIFGVSPASMGVIPSGQKGKANAMGTSTSADMFNRQPEITRWNVAMTKVAQGMLDMIANSISIEDFTYEYSELGQKKVQTSVLVGEKFLNENPDIFKNDRGEDEGDYIIVRHDYEVDVQIAKGLNYTSDSVRQVMVELVKAQVLPPEILQDVYAYGKILEYIDLQRQRDQEKQQMEQQMQSQNQNQQNQNQMQLQNNTTANRMAEQTHNTILEAAKNAATPQNAGGGAPPVAPSSSGGAPAPTFAQKVSSILGGGQ